jgi:hypothetical protein
MRVQVVRDVFADPTLGAAERAGAAAQAERGLSRYMDIGDAPGKISQDFAMAARWAKASGIAPQRVLLGEFGACQQWPETTAGHRSRVDWVSTVRKAAESNGFGWAYWALKDGSGSMGGFRLLPAGATTAFEPETLRALGLSG